MPDRVSIRPENVQGQDSGRDRQQTVARALAHRDRRRQPSSSQSGHQGAQGMKQRRQPGRSDRVRLVKQGQIDDPGQNGGAMAPAPQAA